MKYYSTRDKAHARPCSLREAVEAGANAHTAMRRTTDADRDRDCSMEMAVSYGLDSDSPDEVRADYCNVRGLPLT